MSANQQVVGDKKLVLPVAFPVLSSGLVAVIARTFSNPLNRTPRSSPGAARVTADAGQTYATLCPWVRPALQGASPVADSRQRSIPPSVACRSIDDSSSGEKSR